jgi:hypothetical protein
MTGTRFAVLVAALVACGAGCGKVDPLEVRDAGRSDGAADTSRPPDAGTDAGGCQGLAEAACRATAGCSAGTCSLCGGAPYFSSCYPTGGTPPPCPLAASLCPAPCAGLGETACAAHSECMAQRTCPACDGTTTFVACVPVGSSVAPCPPVSCPLACSSITDLATCDQRTDCHAVFADYSTVCDCATPGCCSSFLRCADGDRATCKGMPLCKSVAPTCAGPYVVSYTATCYEGCVRATECAP